MEKGLVRGGALKQKGEKGGTQGGKLPLLPPRDRGSSPAMVVAEAIIEFQDFEVGVGFHRRQLQKGEVEDGGGPTILAV